MTVWIVDFFEDCGTDYKVFSTREKAWAYLKEDFERAFRDEEWVSKLTKSYQECCESNLDYFENDYVIAIEKVIDLNEV